MRLIPLTNGGHAIVDDEDYDLVMGYGRWHKVKNRNTWKAMCYDPARYKKYSRRKSPARSMSVLLMGKVKGMVVDHMNGDGLDNRRSVNLQHITNAHNVFKTDRTKGYYLDKNRNKWYARARFNGKTRQLGYFDTEQEAKKARDKLRSQGLEYFRSEQIAFNMRKSLG